MSVTYTGKNIGPILNEYKKKVTTTTAETAALISQAALIVSAGIANPSGVTLGQLSWKLGSDTVTTFPQTASSSSPFGVAFGAAGNAEVTVVYQDDVPAGLTTYTI